ncbi:MAG TPA: glycosyltransferase family 2 protein [Bacteroidia bacterium]|nr:glycosyltransferase family 2 protein [Bacteroidia bacterium]
MVSVIIPSYNYAHLLPDTLLCLQQQTFYDWECFVIDDGSTDHTNEIVRSFSEKDKRIKYFYQTNSGLAASRNHGIKLSTGEYIQLLDADDLLEKEKLEVQVSILKNNNSCDVVYSNMKYFPTDNPKLLFNNIYLNEENDKPWMKYVSGFGDKMIMALLRENIMVVNSPLIRKTVFERAGYFDEQLKYNEDGEFWLRCAFKNIVFLFDNTPQTSALVRVHTESHSRDRFKMYVYGLKSCLKINNSIQQWKYKRIILPKIFYHQNVLDRKIFDAYPGDKRKALEMIDLIYSETKVSRYKKYKWLLNNFSYPVCLAYSKILFLLNVFKRILIYAA